jgi:hypothetical protein
MTLFCSKREFSTETHYEYSWLQARLHWHHGVQGGMQSFTARHLILPHVDANQMPAVRASLQQLQANSIQQHSRADQEW